MDTIAANSRPVIKLIGQKLVMTLSSVAIKATNDVQAISDPRTDDFCPNLLLQINGQASRNVAAITPIPHSVWSGCSVSNK